MTNFTSNSKRNALKKIIPQIPVIIGFLFVLLFSYAGGIKLIEFEKFQLELAQSPLLSAYAGSISYLIITFEFIIVLLLCIPRTRLTGLYMSLGLMAGFTIYIYLTLNFSDFIPCSCGGIIEMLGWTEHLIFNIVWVAFAVTGILFYEKRKNVRLFRPLLYSGIITMISCLIVIVLFIRSEYIIKKDNNFTRRFLLHPIIEDRSFDLTINSYYFAGINGGNIYLGNVTAPLILTTIDTALKSIHVLRIHLDKSDYPFRNLQLQVKDSSYYLYDGSVPVIYRGRLGDTLAHTISYNDAYFTQLAPIDSSNFVIRTQSSKTRQYTLASLNLYRNPKLQLHPFILKKQIDGVFDVDGKLITIPGNPEILYSYTYRNQILAMDKQLNILRTLNTIDTTTIAKIQTRRLSDGTHKISSPPLKVNGEVTSNQNLLFIHSSLKGRHELSKIWERAAVVDIYRTDQQEYIGSFYIDNKNKNTFTHMTVNDHFFYVLIEKELKRYQLRDPISKYFN